MVILVLTGGIGSGKSTAAAFFRSRGAVTLDLDEVASHTMAPGSPVLAAVSAAFGDAVIAPDGSLDRAGLADVAFATPEATARLGAIVHPAVAREIGPSLTKLRLLPDPPSVVVIEVPLLAEAPVFAEMADVVLALDAPESLRIARAIGRGMAEPDVRRRLAVQASDEERAALADTVIHNDESYEVFLGELEAFWDVRLKVGT